MKKTIGNLTVRIGADTKQFTNSMRKTQRQTNSLRGSFSKLATVAASAVSAFAAISLIKQSVRAYGEQEKALGKVRQALLSTKNAAGLTFKELTSLAASMQKKTIFGDEEILNNVTAQLLTFTNIAGNNFKRTQWAALNLATVLDGDLKSASIQLGKALNDPVANLSALSRSGIQFSDEQKKLIKSLADTNRLAEAQTIILDELDRQYGGQAEAMAKLGTGPLAQLSNTWGDLTEAIGGAIVNSKAFIVTLETLKSLVSGLSSGNWGIPMPKSNGAGNLTQLLRKAFDLSIKQQLEEGYSLYYGERLKAVFSDLGRVAGRATREEIEKEIAGLEAGKKLVGFRQKTLSDEQIARINAYNMQIAYLTGLLPKLSSGADGAAASITNLNNSVTGRKKYALDTLPTKGVTSIPQSGTAGIIDNSTARSFEVMGSAVGTLTSQMVNFNAVMIDIAPMIGSAFTSMASLIGDAIGDMLSGTADAGTILQSIIGIIAQFLRALGEAMVAAGIASEAFKSLLGSGYGAIVAGLALIATSSLVTALMSNTPTAFAEGGIVYGPTLGMVGEYSGARTNPEVIAPLSKLQGMMGNNVNVSGTFRVRGTDLYLALEKYNDRRNTYT